MEEYNKTHKRFRIFAYGLIGIIALISGMFVLSVFGSDFWLNDSDKSPYNTIPIIFAFALLVGSPMIWLAHVLLREAAKYHALKEDAFTKGQIIILIDTGGYDKEKREHLIQYFITHHERQSSANIVLNTKPPSIPQKSGFDSATDSKNQSKAKNN